MPVWSRKGKEWQGACALFVAVGVMVGPTGATGAADLRSFHSGNGLLNRGLYGLAVGEYRKFLDEHRDHEMAATARYGLAFSLFHLGEFETASGELAGLMGDAAFEFAAEAALIHGQCRMSLKAYDDAAGSFATIIAEHPTHDLVDDALALQTEAYYRAGRFDDVAGPAERLARDVPNSPHRERAGLFWGMSDMARESYAAAATRFDEMVRRYPQGDYAHQTGLLLAQSLHRGRDVERALVQYQEVINAKTAEYTPDALYGMALLLHQSDRAQHAGFFLDQLFEEHGRDVLVPDARLLRGRVWFDLDDYDQAAAQFDMLVDAPGRHQAEACYWRAKCDLRRDRPGLAAARLARVLSRFPAAELVAEMTYDHGVSLLRAGDDDAALVVLGDLRSRFPRHALAADALHLMAVTTHRQGRYDESRVLCDAFTQSYGRHPLVPAITFLAGENEFLARRYDDAATTYDDFLARFAQNTQAAKARFRLGMALYQLGQFDRAAPSLEAVTDGANTPLEFRAALLALGDGHFQNDDWVKAERSLGAYVGFGLNQPAADNALLKLGLCRHRQGRLPQALEAYGQLIDEFATGAHRRQAIFETGQALVALDRNDEAVKAFDHLLAKEPDPRFEVHALNHLGAIAMQREQHDKAATLFGRVADSGDAAIGAEAMYRQGQALMSAERFDAAAGTFNGLGAAYPASPRVPEAAALEVIAKARNQESDAALALVRDVESNHLDALDAPLVAAMWYEKAWCERDLDRLADANKTYRRMLAQSGESALHRAATLELAELEYDKESFGEAADLLRGLRAKPVPAGGEISPDLPERTLYRLAVCAYQLGAFPEAAQLLEEFLGSYAASESVPSASLICGESLAKTGHHQRAIDHFQRVVDQHPDDEACEPSMLQLGECLATLQYFERSERAFAEHRRRFADSPLWYQAQFGIGWALENQGQPNGAIAAYQPVVESHQGPTAARAQFQIGECLFAQKKHEEAARELLKVDILYAYPEWSAAALYETGRCFQAIADPVSARDQFEKVVREHGDTKWSTLARKRLAELSNSRLPGH